jgi:hypothetical protein
MTEVTSDHYADQVRATRSSRPAVVVTSLDALAGPRHGVVELPIRLMWNPDRRFDLDDPDELRWMYENVLREAVSPEEIRRWVNADLLARVWPDLNLPHGVRMAWEARHPHLRPAA